MLYTDWLRNSTSLIPLPPFFSIPFSSVLLPRQRSARRCPTSNFPNLVFHERITAVKHLAGLSECHRWGWGMPYHKTPLISQSVSAARCNGTGHHQYLSRENLHNNKPVSFIVTHFWFLSQIRKDPDVLRFSASRAFQASVSVGKGCGHKCSPCIVSNKFNVTAGL